MRTTPVAALVMVLLQLMVRMQSVAQARPTLSAAQTVTQMVEAELAAWRSREYFFYRNEERSNRTNGRLWDELVVETPDGSMQRLVSEDGKPLSGNRKMAEDRRIAYLANHPEEFRRKTRRRRDDEGRMPELLQEIPNIFLFKTVSSEGDSMLIAFRPNPSFHEESIQDRVVHAMEGTLIIHVPDMRLCALDAHLEHRVEFGFGILGVLGDTTTLLLRREEVFAGQWTTSKIRFHLDGTILLLKSISRDVDAARSRFKPVAGDLNAAAAAAMVSANVF